MAEPGLLLIGLGIALIAIGTYLSLHEWKLEQERRIAALNRNDEVETVSAGLGETLEGLAKLAEALKHHTLGMQLIILGIAIIILGGIIGSVGCLK